jgi:RNA polymerase sigma-70 factor (sigma-E family)
VTTHLRSDVTGSRPARNTVDVAELYAAHRLALVRLAVLLVDDLASAEDVVQDAFAALARRRGALDDPSRMLAYLRVSVVNGARSALRRRRTARAYVPPRDVEPPSPEDRTVLAEEHREVVEALQRLAPRQREVLVLRYWSGLSEAEIAATLDISPGTVKSTASRGLHALERALERHADRTGGAR